MIPPKPTILETLITASNVRSLIWSGDTLVDWAAGGATYEVDGSHTRERVSFSYPFRSILGKNVPPTLALDPANARFAIVQPDGIHVVALQA
jgi:hypothetical protein